MLKIINSIYTRKKKDRYTNTKKINKKLYKYKKRYI